jgi:hypothetical protein
MSAEAKNEMAVQIANRNVSRLMAPNVRETFRSGDVTMDNDKQAQAQALLEQFRQTLSGQ